MRIWLIERRKSRGLTQNVIADNAGISRAYYAQIESSIRSPSIRVAKRLAEELDFEWTSFFEEGSVCGE